MARGFYSLVQYCPDVFRDEAVNVGLVLMRIEPHEVRVRTTCRFERVKKVFSTSREEVMNLKLSVRSMANRIENSVAELKTDEDLAAFAASRGNALRLTKPRLAKLNDFEADFDRLYMQLVEQQSTEQLADASPAELLPPKLAEVFYQLSSSKRIWSPGKIIVPVFKRKLEIPFAYQNGVVNLVKPHVFPASRHAETQAASLAINGDLIKRHPVDGEKRRLIVVSTQETSKQIKEISEHVEPLFKEYGVRLIRPDDADAFAQEVAASAH